MPTSTILDVLRKKWEEIGSTADVTLRTLSLGAPNATTGWYAKTFSESTIKAYIIPRGLQRFILAVGHYTNQDAVAFSKTEMLEGDELEDQNNNFYRVLTIKHHSVLSEGVFYEAELSMMELHRERAAEAPPTKLTGRNNFFETLIRHYEIQEGGNASAHVTLKTLTLGSPNTTTGWYAKSYADSTIQMIIMPSGYREAKGFTQDNVREGDLIYALLPDAMTYSLVTRKPLFIGKKLIMYECDLLGYRMANVTNLAGRVTGYTGRTEPPPTTFPAFRAITECEYIIILEDGFYAGVNGKTQIIQFGGANDEGGIDGDDGAAVFHACRDALGSDGGSIYIKDPIITATTLKMKNNISMISDNVFGAVTDPKLTYTGTDYAIQEYDETTWRSWSVEGMHIKTTHASCKGHVRMGKCNFGSLNNITCYGYATEVAINIPVSSLKGNTKKIWNIDVEGELHMAGGIDCQGDWCYLQNVVMSKTTSFAIRVGDQTETEPPYETHILGAHGYNCQHRFLDIQWAYYLTANHCIDEHDINFTGTKESSWYQAADSDPPNKKGKDNILFDCNAFYNVGAGYPPAPYVELIDNQNNIVFMRNDSPTKGTAANTGLSVIPKLIVDDHDRGVADVLQVIGKHSDLARFSNTTVYAVHTLGVEYIFAVNDTDFKIWNVTDSAIILDIELSGGVIRCKDILPAATNTHVLGNTNWRFNSAYINTVRMFTALYMDNMLVLNTARDLTNCTIDGSQLVNSSVDHDKISGGETVNITVALDGGGTVTLQFEHGVLTGHW